MSKEVKVYFDDIMESIAQIEKYTGKTTDKEFFKNTMLQDAVMRRLEIIGESVKNISDNFREQYPYVPWKNIAGMRDILIHEYSGVNMKRIWKVIIKDIPALKIYIKLIVDKIEKQNSTW